MFHVCKDLIASADPSMIHISMFGGIKLSPDRINSNSPVRDPGPSCFVLANSADPDEMPPDLAFHLGLHCLPRYPE